MLVQLSEHIVVLVARKLLSQLPYKINPAIYFLPYFIARRLMKMGKI